MDQSAAADNMDGFKDFSEEPGKVLSNAEDFGNVSETKDKAEYHTVTVRQAARMLEDAGVPRTEHSITNWCGPNRQGISRLDCYFDPNEKKYFITQQSIDRVAEEELAKGKSVEDLPNASEDFRNLRNHSETQNGGPDNLGEASVGENRIKELELKLRDAEITNRAKDMHIQRQIEERNWFFEKLNEASHQLGVLETKLLQLEGPRQERATQVSEEDAAGVKENTGMEMGEENTEDSQQTNIAKE